MEDKMACPTGPIILTEIGAGIMSAESCFAADGSFNPSLYCMQRLFQAAGGTTKGTLYPTTEDQARALAKHDAAGVLSMDATMEFLNTQSNLAIYGIDTTGVSQSFDVIKPAALSMLGVTMNNPCDGVVPYSGECLDYLWRSPNASTASTASNAPYLYCSNKGSSAPLNLDGTVNTNNVNAANQNGSLTNIRSYFQNIFNRTQDSSDFDEQSRAMKSCFGVSLAAQPAPNNTDCPAPNPDEWQCFGPTKLRKPEVFYVSGSVTHDSNDLYMSGYSITHSDASDTCDAFGAQVASEAQLTDAQQQGAQWCGAGWVSDTSTRVKWPMQVPRVGCGNSPGIIEADITEAGWLPRTNGNVMAGVNCFGRKPPVGTGQIAPFSPGGSWYSPNSLPPGISDTSVLVGKENSETMYCGSMDGSSCVMFPNEASCESNKSGTNIKSVPLGTLTDNGNINPRLVLEMDRYLRGRV